MYRCCLKRVCDTTASAIGLVIVSPILLIFTVVLTIANNGSPFFFQMRPGKQGRIFRIIKFRTMNNKKDKDGKLLPDNVRLTKIGKFVRSTSIDELPQMINVLKGDMSFIGPRPLLVGYLPLYSVEQARRHDVRPGITGWAQVNGRNLMKLSKKFEYDVWYVDNLSMALDIKIIFITIKNIVLRKNIGTGSADMKQVDDLHFNEQLIQHIKQGK